jgi:hypothetical protein
MFFLNGGTRQPDYLPQSIKTQHESSLLRNSKSHKIISLLQRYRPASNKQNIHLQSCIKYYDETEAPSMAFDHLGS